MVRSKSRATPSEPATASDYDYVLTLSDAELAWEFLRRNPDYQSDANTSEFTLTGPRQLPSGQVIWQDRGKAPEARGWSLDYFIDPKLPAPKAPICWTAQSGAAHLEAVTRPPTVDAPPDITLAALTSVTHVVSDRTSNDRLLIRTSDAAIDLKLTGPTLLDAPVDVTFQVAGFAEARRCGPLLAALPDLMLAGQRRIKHTLQQVFMRDTLIALDARAGGASYRGIAAAVEGTEQARIAWAKPGRALKDRMRRALSTGQKLRDGGYRKLIG